MRADEIIAELRSWAATLPLGLGEFELHEKTRAVLQKGGVVPSSEHPIENRKPGKSRIDLYVRCEEPRLLIEIKASGDWRDVAQATWQLFQASALLAKNGAATACLVLTGTRLADPVLYEFLRQNRVASVEAGESRGALI